MPLPRGAEADRAVWPPEFCEPVYRRITEWAAWWAGDPQELAGVYGGAASTDQSGFFRSGEYGGSAGPGDVRARRFPDKTQRSFWGADIPAEQIPARTHIPLPADIATTSAGLLYAEPPTIRTDGAAQEVIETLADDGLWATMIEAAETGAALGGRYWRIVWDKERVASGPWPHIVQPDTAVPEWYAGRLWAVTFWTVLESADGKVWRHLERHDAGTIEHGLFLGDADHLGKRMPLISHAKTKLLPEEPIKTGVKMLTAGYVPNIRPNRVWRLSPAGAPFGRSDFASQEGLFGDLDEAWTDWMRDLRLGKARLMIPDSYLTSMGVGQGAHFNLERELLTSLNSMPGSEGDKITQVQFAIRVDEHERTCRQAAQFATRGAGYSAWTFGLTTESAATATEIKARARKTTETRGHKVRYERPGLLDMLQVLLAVGAVHFGWPTGDGPADIRIEFPPVVSEDPEARARTIQLLDAAGAISTMMKVMMAHPEWDERQVAAEVLRIQEGAGPIELTDPNEFTGSDDDGADDDADGS